MPYFTVTLGFDGSIAAALGEKSNEIFCKTKHRILNQNCLIHSLHIKNRTSEQYVCEH